MPRSIFAKEIKFFSLLDDTPAMGLDSMAGGIAPNFARAYGIAHGVPGPTDGNRDERQQ